MAEGLSVGARSTRPVSLSQMSVRVSAQSVWLRQCPQVGVFARITAEKACLPVAGFRMPTGRIRMKGDVVNMLPGNVRMARSKARMTTGRVRMTHSKTRMATGKARM